MRVVEQALRLVVAVLSALEGMVSSLIVLVSAGWGQEHVEAPSPPHELTELLEDEEVEDTASTDFIVVIARYSVPVEAAECFGEGDNEGDWQRVGVTKNLRVSVCAGSQWIVKVDVLPWRRQSWRPSC